MAARTNADVAAVFLEMAELLRIKGGDPHRARAFGRAGKVIEALPAPVETLLRSGGLERVAGVGEGSVHRIKQILRRGTCDDLERLRAQVAPGLRELVKIKGIGPRTARMLQQRLRVSTVDGLEAAARSGRLLELPRFSVDSVHTLLGEIEHHKGRRGKVPLVEADKLAAEVTAWLMEAPGTVAAVAGGSSRRRRAMIGDFDYLAASDDPAGTVARFTRLPGTVAVLATGEGQASIRLEDGRQADIWVFPPESWGAGLHAFSGSKEHVVELRTRAGRMGLHISEHGVFTKDRSRRLTPGRQEDEIFAAVGLQYIVPELRELRGEMAAAEEGRLPELVVAGDLRGDLHCHTTDSDGTGSAREMAQAAIALGYEYLAITDHSASLAVAQGLDERGLLAQGERLRKLEEELGRLAILRGVEVDIRPDGSLALDPAVLARLDWVVASVHDHFELDLATQTQRLVRAMESGVVDAIGHPTGRRLGLREGIALDLEHVLKTARKTGVALEINAHPNRMDLDDVAVLAARERGVALVLDTDAHSPAHLARREYGLAMARRGWLERRHLLNAQPLDTVRAHRHDRLRRHGVAVPASPRRKAPKPTPPPATPSPASSLAQELTRRPLPAPIRARLAAYLESGTDPELETALAGHGPNPVQAAFNLLAAG